MDSGQKMSKGISRFSFYWRHFIEDTRHKCRILSDDVIFCRLLTDDILITEDDVILSITEDDGINYIHILHLYTGSV